MTDQPYKNPRVARLVAEHAEKTRAIAEAEAARAAIEQDLAAEAFGLKPGVCVQINTTSGRVKTHIDRAQAFEMEPGALCARLFNNGGTYLGTTGVRLNPDQFEVIQ